MSGQRALSGKKAKVVTFLCTERQIRAEGPLHFKHRSWSYMGSAVSMASLPLGGSSITAERQTGPFNPLTSFNLLVSLAVGRTKGPVINGSLGKGQRSEAHSLIIIILNYSSFRATFSPILRKGPISVFQDTEGQWPNPAPLTVFPFLSTSLTSSPWPKRIIVGSNSQRGPSQGESPEVSTGLYTAHSHIPSSAEGPTGPQDAPTVLWQSNSSHRLCHQTRQRFYKLLTLER